MFIRNHPDGIYYNGKLGTVKKKEEDILWVQCKGEKASLAVSPIEWKIPGTKWIRTQNR